jgi:signal transduction histidine kinase
VQNSPSERPGPVPNYPWGTNLRRLLPYIAGLELEVDRLRRHGRFVYQEMRGALEQIRALCQQGEQTGTASLEAVGQAVADLVKLLRELQDPPGYHPSHDQVVAISVRALAEHVFRLQQRLLAVPNVALRLDLESESIDWFPARLRHILDNLLGNALKYCDPGKAESWVLLGMRVSPEAYELRVCDNGIGLPPGDRDHLLDLFYRSSPVREAGLGVGLAVVRLLVEQSGGSLTLDSGEGQGTTFSVILPRYELEDYLV